MIHLRKTVTYLFLLLFCITFNWAAKIDLSIMPPSPEREADGYLHIATSPPNAKILVDGELLGKTSKESGIFKIKVSKVVEIEREVSAGEDTIVVSDIFPFTTGDTIVIAGIGKSEIARIKEISGKSITLAEPLENDYKAFPQSSKIEETNARIYRRRIVRIQKEFYNPKRIDVLITEGEITKISLCELSRGQSRALTVISNPLKASVYINDELQYPLSHLVTGTGNRVKDGHTMVQLRDVSTFEVGEKVTLDDDDSRPIKATVKDINKLQNIITLTLPEGGTKRVSGEDLGQSVESNMFTAEQNGYIKLHSPFKTPCTLHNMIADKYKVKLVSEDKKMVWQDEIELNVGQAELINAELIDDKNSPKIVDSQIPFLINYGDKVTSSQIVWLSFNVYDETEVAEVLISNDGENAPRKYASQIKWRLSPHPDRKQVQVRFRDYGGNETQIYTAEIRLIPPYGMQYIKVDEENSFYIDKHEVTNAQYKKFIDETGYNVPKGWNKKYRIYPSGTADYPVVNVSWEDANNYAKWLGQRLQYECQLPTEEQWMRAAKGLDRNNKWPWGNIWKGTITNVVDWKTGDGVVPVDKFPDAQSEDEVYNMAGNVWEWIAGPEDYVQSNLMQQIINGGQKKNKLRRIRSGLKIEDGEVTTLDGSIEKAKPDRGYSGVGFRCVIPIKTSTDETGTGS